MAEEERGSPRPEPTPLALLRINQGLVDALHVVLQGMERPETVPAPSRDDLGTLLEQLYWASLQLEEGRGVVGSFVLAPPEACSHCMVFEPEPISASRLRRLAMAADPDCSAFGVFDGKIWGVVLNPPTRSTMLTIVGPGDLLVRHGLEVVARIAANALLDFSNGAARNKVWRGWHANHPSIDFLGELSYALRLLRTGGTVLVTPGAPADIEPCWAVQDASRWDRYPSQTEAEANAEANPDSKLWAARAEQASEQRDTRRVRVRDALARLAAVDGALVLDPEHTPIAFGAKITVDAPPGHVALMELPHTVPVTAQLSELGATRHASAARYVWAHPDTIALVVSQDGAVSIMTSAHADGVQELRVSRGFDPYFSHFDFVTSHFVNTRDAPEGQTSVVGDVTGRPGS